MVWSSCTFLLLCFISFCAAEENICSDETGILEFPGFPIVEGNQWECHLDDVDGTPAWSAECFWIAADCSKYQKNGDEDLIEIIEEEEENFGYGADARIPVEKYWEMCIRNCNLYFSLMEDFKDLGEYREAIFNQFQRGSIKVPFGLDRKRRIASKDD